ncbi:MAG: hypothetical protein KGI54_06010 [Pseudomonadota bacterium]|nr:hypothetical protein [Pseudomonadota bacterium]
MAGKNLKKTQSSEDGTPMDDIEPQIEQHASGDESHNIDTGAHSEVEISAPEQSAEDNLGSVQSEALDEDKTSQDVKPVKLNDFAQYVASKFGSSLEKNIKKIAKTSGVNNDTVEKAMAGKEISVADEESISRAINKISTELKNRMLANSLRRRETGRKLIEESVTHTGVEIEFVSRLQPTYDLFEKFFMQIDDGFTHALQHGYQVLPLAALKKLTAMLEIRAVNLDKQLTEDCERMDVLIGAMISNKPNYHQVSAGEYKRVKVRVSAKISLKLIEAFRKIDPLLISIDTLWWNGEMNEMDKKAVIVEINKMLSEMFKPISLINQKIDGVLKHIAAS